MSMLENPQELPEEDVTRHNLGIGEIGSEDETETMRYIFYDVLFTK